MKFIITRLYLEHFGQFHKKEIIPEAGLNVIYGPNEAGKSTICHFILAMLFGMERGRGRAAKDDMYAKYLPWEPGGYSGTMEFVWDNKAYVLYRNFTISAKRAVLTEVLTGTEYDVTERSVCAVLGIEKEKFWQQMFLPEESSLTQNNKFQTLLQDVMTKDEAGDASLAKALDSLEKQRKEWKKQRQDERLVVLERKLEEERYMKERLAVCTERQEQLEKEKTWQEERIRDCEQKKEECIVLEQRTKQVKRCSMLSGVLFLLGLFCFFVLSQQKAGLLAAAMLVLLSFAVLLFCKPLSFLRTQAAAAKNRTEMLEQSLAEQEQAETEKEWCVQELFEVRAEVRMLEERLTAYTKIKTEHTSALEKQKKVLSELRAIEVAMDALKQAGIQVQEEKRIQLNKVFSSYLQTLTTGVYGQAHLNEQAQWKIFAGEQYRDGKVLSSGTAEQLALSFKLAAEELFAEGKELPLMLDDAFVYYDEERCLAALKTLYEKKRQVFLFTCHTREERLLCEEGMEFGFVSLGTDRL